MMITLETQLEEYKKVILNLIESAKAGEGLSELLNKKKNILKEIEEAGYDKNEIQEYVKKLEILELENELQLTIKKEMVTIKKKIENFRTAKKARQNYRNLDKQNIVLFRGKA